MPLLQAVDTLFSRPVVTDTVLTDTVVTIATTLSAAASPMPDTAVIGLSQATGEAVGTVQAMLDSLFAALPRIGVALVVFFLIWLVAKGVQRLVHRITPGPRNSSIGIVLGRLTYAALLLVGALVAAVIVFPAFTFASLIGALGIGGVAIGFAFQDIFQNLLAGILILLREPFRIGDEIVSDGYTGTVEAIETRATFIRTYDGRRIIIPNSKIYTEPVTVITAYDLLRSQYDLGIGYGDSIEEAKQIALDTMTSVDGVLKDPAPDVLMWDLAASTVNLRLRWWTHPTQSNVLAVRDRVLRNVAEAMAAGGIDLPFPTQVVLFHDQTEETDGDRTQQREGWPAPRDGRAPRPARLAAGDGAARDSEPLPGVRTSEP
jgi:small-conductance mechanosensitive channel